MKKLVLMLVVFLAALSFSLNLRAQDGALEYKSSYSRIADFVRQEDQKIERLKLEYKDIALIAFIDLGISLICLILVLHLPGKKLLTLKGYLWFLVAYNLGAIFLFLLLKGAWLMLAYLVVNANPETFDSIRNSLYSLHIINFVVLYIWLLARTFGLNFFDSLRTFVVSHLAYFLIVFLVSLAIPVRSDWRYMIKDQVGAAAAYQGFINEVNVVSDKRPVQEGLQLRFYHL